MIARACRAYVAWAARRAPAILVAALALALVAAALAARLELRTDMAELLPARHPAVLALRDISRRQRGGSSLVVLVHGRDGAATQAFTRALRDALASTDLFTEIEDRPDAELAAFARAQRWLYAPQAELDEAEGLLDRLIAQHASPLAVELDDPAEGLERLRARLEHALPPPAVDRFEEQDGAERWVGLRLWRAREGLASRGDHEALAAVKAAVARLDPRGLGVEYTGPIAQALDEQDGIRDDLTLATAICLGLVLLAIGAYFRRLALVLIVGVPAVLGVLLALALAAITTGALNLNTAFLISILLGNGINAPIVLLARYVEARQAGEAVEPALAIAMHETVLGTALATGAASLAYGSLALTQVRGYSQFGLLGGAGMLLVWIVAYALVPALVLVGERRIPRALAPRSSLFAAPFARLGRAIARRSGAFALLSLLALLVALPPLVRYARDPLEWDFHRLRAEDARTHALWQRMERLGMGSVGAGFIGNSAVLRVDEPGEAQAVAAALRARGEHLLAAVRTLDDVLPRDQDARLAQLARIRRKLDRHRAVLDDSLRAEVDAWRPPEGLRALGPDDLPRRLRLAFTEIDGTRGRLIGLDADYAVYSDWNGHDLLRMAEALRVEVGGKRYVAAAAATVFAGMLEAVLRDGPRVTAVALLGVVALMGLTLGARGALPVLGALALGVAWLGGAAGALGLKINFMNFVALPITLGVGADYAANVWARLRRDGAIVEAIAQTGSAVALCSMTTVIGYSSLLLSRNPALRSFGLLADLGELTCLVAALVAMPAVIRRRR